MTADHTETLRVGTRSSLLATTQTGHITQALERLTDVPVQTVRVRTEGDFRTGPLAAMGGTGVFVAALRDAILDGRCDLAVHSLKDLPVAPVDGLVLVIPERVDARDALCARDGGTLEDLAPGARVGTGSPRRAAQLRAARPDLDIVDIRGNVDTRLSRALGPHADLAAVVLARAGLHRLDRLDAISQTLSLDTMCPAPGQGALAVECRADLLVDSGTAPALSALDHEPTRLAVTAERAVLARLDAGCAAPVGAYGHLDGDTLTLTAVALRPDGSAQLRHSAHVDLPAAPADREFDSRFDRQRRAAAADLGTLVAEALLADGAAAFSPDIHADPQ